MSSNNEGFINRVYISLDGLSKEAATIECTFGAKSFDLRIINYKGKNWRYNKESYC